MRATITFLILNINADNYFSWWWLTLFMFWDILSGAYNKMKYSK